MDQVRFYFSFRSPYAWLAFHQAPPTLRELPVELNLLPVFPPPDFPNDPTAVPNKMKYMIEQDIPRLAGAMGLPLEAPAQRTLCRTRARRKPSSIVSSMGASESCRRSAPWRAASSRGSGAKVPIIGVRRSRWTRFAFISAFEVHMPG